MNTEKLNTEQHNIDRRAATEVRKVIMMRGIIRLSPPVKATSWRTSVSIQFGIGSSPDRKNVHLWYRECDVVRKISDSFEPPTAARASTNLGVNHQRS